MGYFNSRLRDGQRLRARGGAGASSILRVAETNGRIANALLTLSDARINIVIRMPCILGQDMSILQIDFYNFYFNATGNIITNLSNDYFITDLALEDNTSTSVPIYFGGSRSKTITAGAANVRSDKILPSSFSLSKFSRGEQYWIKGKLNVASTGHSFPNVQSRSTTGITGAQWHRYDPAATTPSSTDTYGAYTATGTALNSLGSGMTPILIGTPVDSTVPAYIAGGDSITYSNADTATGVGGIGFTTRSMYNGGTNPVPCLNLSRAGTRLDILINNTQWRGYMALGTDYVEGWGVNSLYKVGSSGIGADGSTGESLATFQTKLLTHYADVRTLGIKRIHRRDFFPYTTSTDAWATVALQTAVANWAVGGYRDQFKTWVRTQMQAGVINNFIEMTSCRDATDTDKWVASGTADGQHPAASIHTSSIPEMRKIIDRNQVLAISGLGVAFDPSYPITIAESAGAVSELLDISGNINHATQSTAASKPTTGTRTINSLNTLDFDGGDVLNLTTEMSYASGNTIFAVVEFDDTATNKTIISGTTGGPNIRGDSTEKIDIVNAGTAVVLDGTASLAAATVVSVVTSDGLNQTWLDGVSDGSNASSPAYTKGLGYIGSRVAADYMDGKIGELIVFNRVLSTTERQTVETYLTTKW